MKNSRAIAIIKAVIFYLFASTVIFAWGLPEAVAQSQDHIFTTGPIDTDAAGKGGEAALESVLLLVCKETDSAGTGFVHKSGLVITAAHVVRGCAAPIAVSPREGMVGLRIQAADDELDLALLVPFKHINATPLPISSTTSVKIGTRVAAWGFPGGYRGRAALLSVGYLSGVDAFKIPSNRIIRQFVVNAAFNSGNSGGPLLNIESGEVIGVVSSKLAPLPEEVSHILDVLSSNPSGLQFSATNTDGVTRSFSESQVIGVVLDALRKQVQLVIGYAVLTGDLKDFLSKNGVDP